MYTNFISTMGACNEPCSDSKVSKQEIEGHGGSISLKGERVDNTRVLESFLNEVNAVRKNPMKYADLIEKYYKKYVLENTKGVSYFEGAEAFKEAQTALRNLGSLPQLVMEPGLVASSYEHAVFLAQTGMISDVGRGASQAKDRIGRFGHFTGTQKCGEVNTTQSTKESSKVIIELLVDDGVITRKNREALLDANMKKFGCGIVKTTTDGDYMIVMNFADDSFKTDNSSPDLTLLLIKAESDASK